MSNFCPLSQVIGRTGVSSERMQPELPPFQPARRATRTKPTEPRVTTPLAAMAGPRGHWLWGSLPELRLDMLTFFERQARAYGDMVPIRFADRRIALVSHPRAIEEVLVTENRKFTKHYAIQLLRSTLGNGLLNNEGESWLRQRRLCQPAFGRDRIEAYGATMISLCEKLLGEWSRQPRRDLHADMMHVTLDIAAKTLLNVDVGDDSRQVSECIDAIMDDFTYRFQSALTPPLWVPTAHNRRLNGSIRRLDKLILSIIAERRASGQDKGDLLSMLVQVRDEDDGTGMTDRQLRDEVVTMLLAGHETTAVTLSWTWYLLARNPGVEEKLLAELDAVLGGRLPTAADMPRLVYCERVIREAMRLFPPAYTIGRQAKEAVEIDGCLIPKGTNILMSQWIVHHDPRWFEDPLAFNPDRWNDNLAGRIPKYAYFPFGGGPRICIGNMFAMLEAVLLLATILPRYKITLDPTQHVIPRPAVTLRPADGIRAVVTPRENSLQMVVA